MSLIKQWQSFFRPGKLYRRLSSAGYVGDMMGNPIIMFIDGQKKTDGSASSFQFKVLTEEGKVMWWPGLTFWRPEAIWEEIV